MPKRTLAIAFMAGFAISCFLIFDSLFIDVAAASVVTLLLLLVPVTIIYGDKRTSGGRPR